MLSRRLKWIASVVVTLYFLTIALFYELPFGSTIFQDIPGNHWAVYDIEYMYNNGYMKGRDKEVWKFYPTAEMTRAELVALILKIEGVDITTLPKPTDQQFTDIPPEHWAGGVLAEANKRKLIPFQGITGQFEPDKPVTRGELAQAVVQTVNLPVDMSGAQDLPDVQGSPYEAAIRTVVAKKYAQGNSDGKFRPDEVAQREQVASLFARALREARPGTAAEKGGK